MDQSILKKVKIDIIFANIEEIMNLHLPMLYDLEQCIRQNTDDVNIGEIFVKSVRILYNE